MQRLLRMMAVAAVLAGTAGCGPRLGPRARAQPVPVKVTNRNRSDVVMYVVRSGNVSRLGTVVSGETRTLFIRNVQPGALRELQFDVRRIGAEGVYRTAAVTPGQDQMVVVRIEDLLTTSQVTTEENPASNQQRP